MKRETTAKEKKLCLQSRTEQSLHPFKLSQIKAGLDIYRIIFSLKQSNLHVVYLILIHDLFHFPISPE